LPELLAHLALAASAFLSSTLLPGTSEVGLAAAVARWPGHWHSLFAVATLANTAGAAVNWWLGTQLERFAGKRWFPVSAERLAQARWVFQRFGFWSLLFSWLPVVGDPLTLVAGMMKFRFLPFIALVAAGKAVRYGVLIAGLSAVT
jgi:membrane protein YqaA with SNARE-associated domain